MKFPKISEEISERISVEVLRDISEESKARFPGKIRGKKSQRNLYSLGENSGAYISKNL